MTLTARSCAGEGRAIDRALRDRGLRAGHDVAVVGYNDVSIAAELPTALTSVRSPLRTMGARAVTMPVERLEGRSVTSVLLAPQLIVRASSDPLCGR